MDVVEGHADIDDVGAFVAELDAIGETHGVTIQAFDARYVVDREHLVRAVDLAARARERGDTIAEDFGVEILLYAAGRRQINRALAMGVCEGECPIVAVVVGEVAQQATSDHVNGDAGAVRGEGEGASVSASGGTASDEAAAAADLRERLTPAETLGNYDEERVRDFFDVTDTELAATEGALADAIRERVALLVVEK
ncbi:KEOPS complex subunit Cgi121 [Haloarcula salinisoli]|uniref:KEOPS complex subunit Cgi121 n=1 Tax=Haloarcula salinisoli TaxID=2487746 RepID=A0A8J8CBD1_9EURY|nr:KEOPS complex subunit Cgi121 [Halomicroarcula salinisoli]MBX0286881.1 KEOPS complex subunit Cgi121 [Halomicroarcula salinisoli]MBX0304183.1 KEOPS complex subunit Cgi121 [Halomicroarcula salinisoli]